MNKRFSKKVVVNNKHINSEMAANNSYKSYHQRIKKFFTNVANPFVKIKK